MIFGASTRRRYLTPYAAIGPSVLKTESTPGDVTLPMFREDLGSFARLASMVAGLATQVSANDQKALVGPWVALAHANASHGHIPGLKL